MNPPDPSEPSGKVPAADPPAAASQLDRFCAFAREDAALLEELCRPHDIDAFAALMVAAGRRHAFPFTADDVRSAIQANVAREAVPPGNGWLPIDASWRGDELLLDWSHFGARPLRKPFFADSVRSGLSRPFNRLFRHSSPITSLSDCLKAHPGAPPSGFIFHMSRCGSTLVSRMLMALARNIVISEASPIDAVVQASHARRDLTDEQHALWLKWIVGAFGHPRCGDERHLFVKLDSWHTLALPLFRRAFPSVPWIFVYRDPLEVLVSQLRQPGIQMVPGLLPPLFDVELSCPPLEYRARVLAQVCEPILQHYSPGCGGLLVNYRQLPDALWTAIMPHFGVACNESDRVEMTQAARYDAKSPGLAFTSDGDAKQQAATPAARCAADKWLGDIYRRLEELRLAAS